MKGVTLPDWLSQLLAECPAAGKGVHAWLFKTARQLHAHYPAPEIVRLLEQGAAQCGRPVAQREIQDAVQAALQCAWTPASIPRPMRAVPKWPAVNQEQREAIIRDGPGLADLWDASPVRFENNDSRTEEIVDVLFPGNPLLCCGWSAHKFDTRPREEWRDELCRLQLIVPSPMTAPAGTTQDGRESKHTLNNTGPRRFLVIEFDQGSFDDHAAILAHLAEFGPLVLAVHSGNKSLHGWFHCSGRNEEKLHRFMRYATTLGADPATWTRSQFVRLPDGRRDTGARQAVLYFNPKPIQEGSR